MRVREQLSIRRLLLAVVVAALMIKLAEASGLISGFRTLFSIAEQGTIDWVSVTGGIVFAVFIWLNYTFWLAIVLPRSIERYLASRKLRSERRLAMLKSLEEFDNLRKQSESRD